ncbi:endonuclease/exonuclease/phosphatase family protein [Streptomyces sp. NPDC094049]|uniref:endonuclease/exonuclease/phosphatase family protein n=1 Tax=Streptomyces sp. NPDC094049 TaxID=3154987 RepID=UPI003333855D
MSTPLPALTATEAEAAPGRAQREPRTLRTGIPAGSVRAVTWNLLRGGVDGSDESRLDAQTEILADLAPDVLCLPECGGWEEQDERRLWQVAHRLGMAPVAMAPSHIGDGRNFTTLLYRPDRLRLLGRRILGVGVFHHALIRARLRPLTAGNSDEHDFLAIGTHLSHVDGEARLREARWLTDYGAASPGVPPRTILLGDLNTPDREPPDGWSSIPTNLHSRYRQVLPTGRLGRADRRAVQVLLASGWTDPQELTGKRREATVGYYYANELVSWSLDYGLVSGLAVNAYRTYDTPEARVLSDHLPVVLDVKVGHA